MLAAGEPAVHSELSDAEQPALRYNGERYVTDLANADPTEQ